MAKDDNRPIIVKKRKVVAGGHHGGAWKVAYADFVTAMMAFFMVMWLVATMPQEQLGGVADYFKNPSAVEGQAAAMAPGSMGPGGAGNAPIKMFEHNKPPPPPGQQAEVTPEEARKLLEEQDKRNLEDLKKMLEEAIANSQALAPFKDQLLIDLTPEGLRIQIVDSQNRPMFDLGSSRLKDYSLTILTELSTYLNLVPNRIAISGHTDITPFSGRTGDRGYSNWELSAERAASARRALVAGGLSEAKLARIVGLSSSVLFDKAQPNNPINRRISIVVLNEAAERQARETDSFIEGEGADAAGEAGSAEGGEAEAPVEDAGTGTDAEPPPAE